MTIEKEIKLQTKSIKEIPVVLWAKFKAKCATQGITITTGFTQAITTWLEKE